MQVKSIEVLKDLTQKKNLLQLQLPVLSPDAHPEKSSELHLQVHRSCDLVPVATRPFRKAGE